MFTMTHNEIAHAYRKKKFCTFANPVVNYRPQKDDPNHFCITAMGNLIMYNGELSVRTADINTAKLHWNSVMSTPNAKYMCLNIKYFYLTAALKYFEYMKMPLNLFPVYIIEQLILQSMLRMEGYTPKCDAPSGAFCRRVSLPTNAFAKNWPHLGIMSASIHLASGIMKCV